MTRFILIAALAFTAAPALANYGDIETQIENAKLEVTSLAQMLAPPKAQIASAGTCKLSQEHLVSVPAEFATGTSIAMACLEE